MQLLFYRMLIEKSTGMRTNFLFFSTKRDAIKRLFFGAGYEARTRYLHLGKVALYQMS